MVYPGPQWSEPRVLAWLTADYTIREIQDLTINNVLRLLLTGSNGLYWTAATSTGWQVEKIATIGETDHATPLRTPQGVTIAISGETIRHLAVSLASPPVNEPSNEASPQAPRHALLLVIDTLRADAIQQANTPHLNQVATRALVSRPRGPVEPGPSHLSFRCSPGPACRNMAGMSPRGEWANTHRCPRFVDCRKCCRMQALRRTAFMPIHTSMKIWGFRLDLMTGNMSVTERSQSSSPNMSKQSGTMAIAILLMSTYWVHTHP